MPKRSSLFVKSGVFHWMWTTNICIAFLCTATSEMGGGKRNSGGAYLRFDTLTSR